MKLLKLTPREREILELTAFGSSAKEIAAELNIQPDTVETHLKNIRIKTGLQKATELECLYMFSHYHLPVIDIPERIRRVIAAALLTLTVFTCIFETSPLLRIFRGNGRPQAKSVNMRAGSSRARRSKEFEFAI